MKKVVLIALMLIAASSSAVYASSSDDIACSSFNFSEVNASSSVEPLAVEESASAEISQWVITFIKTNKGEGPSEIEDTVVVKDSDDVKFLNRWYSSICYDKNWEWVKKMIRVEGSTAYARFPAGSMMGGGIFEQLPEDIGMFLVQLCF